jgi:ParB family transcriptional regulator, chromosome partitioning protein
LQSLIPSMPKKQPGRMEFARELKRLHDEGWDYAKIARLACRSEKYVRYAIRLAEQVRGERNDSSR